MRANRLLSILATLQVHGRVTAHELAERFEVSRRTIYRDVDELSASGVPIYADRGPGGGFQLLEGYRTRLTGLSSSEAEALMLVGLSGPAAELGMAEQAASVRLKLLAALPAESTGAALRVGERFHLDPLDWYRRAQTPGFLDIVSKAVWQARRLSVEYETWSSVVHRTLDPLGLVLKAGAWYLVARSSKGIRTYRVDKLRDALIFEQSFERPRRFDLARHWADEVTRFEASLRRRTATLRVAATALSRIESLGSDISEAVHAALPDVDGSRTAQVPIESIDHAAGLLLGFADEIEAIAPAALGRRIAERAARVVALYVGRGVLLPHALRHQLRTLLADGLEHERREPG